MHASALGEIATRLGVTKASTYHYFPTKHALLLACFERVLGAVFASLEWACQAGATGFEKIRLIVQGYLSVPLDEMNRCVILTEEHVLLPEHREIICRKRDEFEAAMRESVKEGIVDGSVVPCDPKLAIFVVWVSVNSVAKWFLTEGPWNGEQLAQAMADMVCRSLASNPVDSRAIDVSKVVPSPVALRLNPPA